MNQETQMLLGLFLGIALMIVLVMKTKTHTFIALLLAAAVAGLVGGMKPADAVAAISSGFGNTLARTGIIIGLGVMLGGVLEKTGAAERLAYSVIKLIGSGKEEWALGVTGWIVSIPVFADSALVIFRPLTKALSRVTGKSVIGLALALACGLQCTHNGTADSRTVDSCRDDECRCGADDSGWRGTFHTDFDRIRSLFQVDWEENLSDSQYRRYI